MAHVVFIDSTPTGLNAFRTARDLGHQVTFIRPTQASSFVNIMSKDPDKLNAPLRDVDRYIEVKTLENEELFPVLEQLEKELPIDAIISSAETGIMPVAHAAEKWRTRYPSPQQLGNAVFKHQLRETLARHGIRSPRFEVLDEDALFSGPKTIAYPFVVKPVRGFAKQYSAICHTPTDFTTYLKHLREDRANSQLIDSVVSHEYIIEEYVTGTLHSAETIVREGKVMLYATTTRYRAHYYDLLELAAVMPSGLSNEKRSAIQRYLQSIFDALQITIGLYHVELLMTEEGPVLVEINARMMGSVSPIMYKIQTGQDAFAHLVRLHLGEEVTVNDEGFSNAGITLAVAARHGGHISEHFMKEKLVALLKSYGIPHNTLNIEANKFVGRYGGNFSIMGHVIILADTPAAVAEKGHRFLCDMDELLGLETAKYFER